MLRTTRWLLILLDAGNWVAMLCFAITMVMLALGLPPVSGHFARAALPGQEDRMRHLIEIMFMIGILTGIAVDILFRRLIAIIDTVARKRPFTSANALKLRHIALALLAIQVLDLGFGINVGGINRVARHPVLVWSPSLTGWLGVLLLFALAQVFVRGAQLQDEIEAII